jgi:hypothetical protein
MIASVIAGVFLIGGCHQESVPPAPPVTDAQLQALRAQYRQTDATARVGVVTSVLESANLASVSKVPTKDFVEGDIITFMDSNGNVLTLGTVEKVNVDNLAVKYSTPDKKGRVPAPGDVAARFIH